MTAGAPTVLIVDDESHVVHVVRFKLEADGLNVITANNGNLAYDLTCQHRPELIVTDFQMPGGSGLDLAARLSKNQDTASIPLIMLTARGHRAPLAELASTNVRTLLAKPFSPRHLLKKVNELLGREGAAAGVRTDENGAAAA